MFRITTRDVQDLANIVKLEYLPRLKSDIEKMEDWEFAKDMLATRYNELDQVIQHVHSDNFWIEDQTDSE
jgi:hypothetical protein